MRQLVYNMFISNICPSFHLWWQKNLVKHRKVSKYYDTDWGLHCFLLRRKRPKAKPLMEWVVVETDWVKTVLPREVRKLASAIEEKDTQIQAQEFKTYEFTNENHQQKILRLNKEIGDLIANRHVARRGCFDNVLCFIKKNSGEAHAYYIIRCQYRQLEKHKRWLKLRYSNMEVADKCDDQAPFTNGVDLSEKWSRSQATTKPF